MRLQDYLTNRVVLYRTRHLNFLFATALPPGSPKFNIKFRGYFIPTSDTLKKFHELFFLHEFTPKHLITEIKNWV